MGGFCRNKIRDDGQAYVMRTAPKLSSICSIQLQPTHWMLCLLCQLEIVYKIASLYFPVYFFFSILLQNETSQSDCQKNFHHAQRRIVPFVFNADNFISVTNTVLHYLQMRRLYSRSNDVFTLDFITTTTTTTPFPQFD